MCIETPKLTCPNSKGREYHHRQTPIHLSQFLNPWRPNKTLSPSQRLHCNDHQTPSLPNNLTAMFVLRHCPQQDPKITRFRSSFPFKLLGFDHPSVMEENRQARDEKEENEARNLFHGSFFSRWKGRSSQMGGDDFPQWRCRREDSAANSRSDVQPHLPVCAVSCHLSPFARPQNQIGEFLMPFLLLGWWVLA